MDKLDFELLLKIAMFVNPRTKESIQNYKSPEKLINYMVQYFKGNAVHAIWFDVEKLTERDLKYIFKNHKLSNKKFFINYFDEFYRIGFELKK